MRHTNHKYVQSIMDLAARRPDLSISDIERLIERAESAPAKKPRELSNLQIRMRVIVPIWVAVWGAAIMCRWLSGAAWERSESMGWFFFLTMFACTAVSAIALLSLDDDACDKIRRQSKEK